MIVAWMLLAQNDAAAVVPVWVWFVQGGATAILSGVVWAIVTGRLVPRSALLDAQAERDRWIEVAKMALTQNNELLLGTRVTRNVVAQALAATTENGD